MEPNTAIPSGDAANATMPWIGLVSEGISFLKEGLRYAFASEMVRKQMALEDAMNPNPWLMPREKQANISLLLVVGLLGMFFIAVLVIAARKERVL